MAKLRQDFANVASAQKPAVERAFAILEQFLVDEDVVDTFECNEGAIGPATLEKFVKIVQEQCEKKPVPKQPKAGVASKNRAPSELAGNNSSSVASLPTPIRSMDEKERLLVTPEEETKRRKFIGGNAAASSSSSAAAAGIAAITAGHDGGPGGSIVAAATISLEQVALEGKVPDGLETKLTLHPHLGEDFAKKPVELNTGPVERRTGRSGGQVLERPGAGERRKYMTRSAGGALDPTPTVK